MEDDYNYLKKIMIIKSQLINILYDMWYEIININLFILHRLKKINILIRYANNALTYAK